MLFFSILIINFFYDSLEIYFTQFSTAMKIEASLTKQREIISLIFSPLQSFYQAIYILLLEYLSETILLLVGIILIIFFRKYSLYIITGILLLNINSRICLNFSLILILFYYFLSSQNFLNKITLYVFILLSLIFAYSFGSSNNLFLQSMFISILYFVIIYLLLVNIDTSFNRFQSMLIIFVLCCHVIISLKNAFYKPYGYDAKINEFIKTEVSIRNNERLYISKEQSDFMNFIRKVFKNNNWERELPLIDLSGKLPGILYLLDARAVGNPWFNGYFEGSTNYARKIISLSSDEHIKKSWLIFSENEPDTISKQVIEERIGNLNENYYLFAKYNYRKVNYTFWKPLM